MKVLLVVALLAAVAAVDYDTDTSPQTKHQVNFGATFTKRYVLDNTVDKWVHSFIIDLPKPLKLHFDPPSCKHSEKFCEEIHHVYDYLSGLAQTVADRYDVLLSEVDMMVRTFPPELLDEQDLHGRALLAPVGWLARDLFGVSTTDDTDVLAQQILALKSGVTNVANDQMQLNAHLSSFMTSTKARLTNMDKEVEFLHGTMQNVTANMLVLAERGEDNLVDIMSLLTNRSAAAIQQLSDLSQMSEAIYDVVGGRLNPTILPTDQLMATIINIETEMGKTFPHFQLGERHFSYYYREQCAELFRVDDSLLVALYLPITTNRATYDVYEIDTFPVFYQNGTMAATQVVVPPTHLAVARDDETFIELFEEDLSACPGKEVKTCGMAHAVHAYNSTSCAMGLFRGDRKMVMEACEFSFLPQGLETMVFELDPGMIHITNGSNVTMHCPGQAPKPLAPCQQCVVKLPCECSLSVDHFWVADRLTNCLVNHTAEQLHTINLAMVLKLEKEVRADLQGDKLMELKLNTSFPKVKLSKVDLTEFEEVNRKLQLALDSVLDSVAKDNKVITDALDPVLHDNKELQHLAAGNSYALTVFKESGPPAAGVFTVLVLFLTVYFIRLNYKIRKQTMRS